jgi:hypothetical protein
VGGDFDAEAMNKLGASTPEQVHSRPTIPGGMVAAGAFLPGGHQPGQPGGRGGQGPVPTDLAAGSQRPYGGPPPAPALAPAPPRQASPSAGVFHPPSGTFSGPYHGPALPLEGHAAKEYARPKDYAQPPAGAAYTRQTAQALRALHTRFQQPPDETRAAAPVTLAEVNAARRHVAEARCVRCSSFLHGLRAGAAGARKRVTQEQTTEAQAVYQAAEDERMAARQPNEYIARMARRYKTPGLGQAIAVQTVERTVQAQRPKQPIANCW